MPQAWESLAEGWRETHAQHPRLQAALTQVAVYFGDGIALDSVRELARDKGQDPLARRQAVRSLVQTRAGELHGLLFELLDDPAVETEVLRALAAMDHGDIPELVIRRFPRLSPTGREAALDSLSARPVFAKALLKAVAEGRVAPTELSAWQLRQLRLLDDTEVTRMLTAQWPALARPDAGVEAEKQRWRERLDPETLAAADLANGRAVFALACATCHQLYGEGRAFGPDLTGSNRDNLEYLLDHLIAPGAVISPGFEAARIELADGRTLTGRTTPAGGGRVEIQTPAETVVFPEADIIGTEPLGVSLMPAGLLDALTAEQARDLIGYLMHPRQVPLPEVTGGEVTGDW